MYVLCYAPEAFKINYTSRKNQIKNKKNKKSKNIHEKLTFQRCTIQKFFRIFTELYNFDHYLILGHFCHHRKKPSICYQSLPGLTLPQPLVTTNVFSAPVDLSVLVISCRWNTIVCSPCCLASLT